MALDHIEDGEIGSSVRAKLNTMIDAHNAAGGVPSPAHHDGGGSGSPVVAKIAYGFSPTKPPEQSSVTGATLHDLANVNGAGITFTRQTTDHEYLWLWSSVAIRGLDAGGFVDVWEGHALTVSGTSGYLYVSDNPTAATVVQYIIRL